MLKIMAFMAITISLMIASPSADAKRFGSGKSFGKLFKTNPAQQKQAPPAGVAKQQATPAAGNTRGILGGVLGGLLVGGLLASLFGGAFEGIQMMDIIIFGLIAYFALRWFRKMNQAKAATQEHHHAFAGGMPNFGQQTPKNSDISLIPENEPPTAPLNLPRNFDAEVFIKGALDHYRAIQDAWNANDLETIQEYVSPEIYSQLLEERQSLAANQHTEILSLHAEIVRADYSESYAQLSIRFSGQCRDEVEQSEDEIVDIWHLQRDLSEDAMPWLIVGIE